MSWNQVRIASDFYVLTIESLRVTSKLYFSTRSISGQWDLAQYIPNPLNSIEIPRPQDSRSLSYFYNCKTISTMISVMSFRFIKVNIYIYIYTQVFAKIVILFSRGKSTRSKILVDKIYLRTKNDTDRYCDKRAQVNFTSRRTSIFEGVCDTIAKDKYVPWKPNEQQSVCTAAKGYTEF